MLTVCLQRGPRETWLQLCPARGCPCSAVVVTIRILVLFLDKCAQLDSEPGVEGLAGSPSPVLLVLESQGQCLGTAESTGTALWQLHGCFLVLTAQLGWMDRSVRGWMAQSTQRALCQYPRSNLMQFKVSRAGQKSPAVPWPVRAQSQQPLPSSSPISNDPYRSHQSWPQPAPSQPAS